MLELLSFKNKYFYILAKVRLFWVRFQWADNLLGHQIDPKKGYPPQYVGFMKGGL